MPGPRLDACDRILVVEGYGDLVFFAEVLRSIGSTGVFIKEMAGKDNLRRPARPGDRSTAAKLETFLSPRLLAEKRSIGVIADADDDAPGTARWLTAELSRITGQSVRVGGFTAGPPRVGCFVVPAADTPGELESLVWRSWAGAANNAGAKACVEAYLSCMHAAGHSPRSPDKGRLGALLSVLNDDDPRLGPSARAQVIDLTSPELSQVVAFLREL